MGKNNIKIDGDKLRSLLESVSGKSIYQVALDCGYSRNLIAESIRVGVASPIIQNVAKLYGIEPSAYEIKAPVKDPTSGDTGKQISFDDLNTISREELKGLIKEAIIETLSEFKVSEVRAGYEPNTRWYTLQLKIAKGVDNAT